MEAELAVEVGRQPERPDIVKLRRQRLPDAVVDDGVAAADDHLVAAGDPAQHAVGEAGRPGQRQARREVVLVPVVVARLAIGGTRQIEPDQRQLVVGDAVEAVLPARLEQVAEVDVRRDLLAVDFVRRRERGHIAGRR